MGAVVVASIACGACSSNGGAHTATRTTPSTTSKLPRVAVFGDSLIVQAHDALIALGRAHGLSVSATAYFGLAPCDLAPLVRTAIAKRPATLVLAFSGNNLTPCMRHAGRSLTGAAFYAAYRHDVGALVALAVAQHIPVELVAPPTFPTDLDVPGRAALIAQYAAIAGEYPGVSLVLTAPALGGSTYLTSLPCLPGETAALGCHDGRILVRDPASRIHFDEPRPVACPIAGDHCTYSAGAHRYAAAILAGLAPVKGLDYRSAAPKAAIPADTHA